MTDRKPTADFIAEGRAAYENVEPHLQQALDWLDNDAAKAEAFDLIEVAQAHDIRIAAIDAYKDALPEALDRLEKLQRNLQDMIEERDVLLTEKQELQAEVERLRILVDSLAAKADQADHERQQADYWYRAAYEADHDR